MISLDDGIESASSLLLFSTFTSVFHICQFGLSKKQQKVVSCCCEGSGLKFGVVDPLYVWTRMVVHDVLYLCFFCGYLSYILLHNRYLYGTSAV